MGNNVFNSRDSIKIGSGEYAFYRLDQLETSAHVQLDRLPFSIRIMLEALLRKVGSKGVTPQDVLDLAAWQPKAETRQTMAFFPGRVIMQDFTGVPVVVDLASMRDAMQRLGGDPAKINPIIPVDVVIDHSVQVDYFASPDALRKNAEFEFKRNNERYQLLHWAQKSFENLRVVPPATGIVHQVNLEYLTKLVLTTAEDEPGWPTRTHWSEPIRTPP